MDQKTSEGQVPGTRGDFAKDQSEGQRTGEGQEAGMRGGFADEQSEGQATDARGSLD